MNEPKTFASRLEDIFDPFDPMWKEETPQFLRKGILLGYTLQHSFGTNESVLIYEGLEGNAQPIHPLLRLKYDKPEGGGDRYVRVELANGVENSATAMTKALAARNVLNERLPDGSKIPFPMFVKPKQQHEGAGRGYVIY